MQIRISTRHGHLSARTQEKIVERIVKRVRGFHQLCGITLTVDLEIPSRPCITARLTSKHARDFATSDTSNNMWGSIDRIAARLHRNLQRKKEKLVDRHRPHHVNGYATRQEHQIEDSVLPDGETDTSDSTPLNTAIS